MARWLQTRETLRQACMRTCGSRCAATNHVSPRYRGGTQTIHFVHEQTLLDLPSICRKKLWGRRLQDREGQQSDAARHQCLYGGSDCYASTRPNFCTQVDKHFPGHKQLQVRPEVSQLQEAFIARLVELTHEKINQRGAMYTAFRNPREAVFKTFVT